MNLMTDFLWQHVCLFKMNERRRRRADNRHSLSYFYGSITFLSFSDLKPMINEAQQVSHAHLCLFDHGKKRLKRKISFQDQRLLDRRELDRQRHRIHWNGQIKS